MSTYTNFPPEWSEQMGTLLAWPCADSDFSPWLEETEQTFCAIAKAIADRQSLIILFRHKHQRIRIVNRLDDANTNLSRVRMIEMQYDDVWVRDTAPISIETVTGSKLLNFRFNGWGNKYEHSHDARLATKLHETGLFPTSQIENIDFVLEGGSIETDGKNTILTTSQCLLNPNRNPSFDQPQIESLLKDAFGVSRILWIHHGHAEGDDTDSHIDTLARFCDEGTIAYTACEDRADPLFLDLEAMADELRQFTDSTGTGYQLVPLQTPKAIFDDENRRLPATYANFLIINDAVLLPIYHDPADEIAIQRLSTCFPNREIVPIYSTPLIRQYGSIHCMTMQFPKSVALSTPIVAYA